MTIHTFGVSKLTVLLAVFSLISAVSWAADDSSSASLDQGRAASALAELHHINQKEIKLAQLALEKTQSPTVRAYAQRMVSDHQAADDKVQMLAQARSVELKSFQPSDSEQSKMESLKQMTGPKFDQAYLDAMRSGHEIAYVELKTTRTGLKDAQVSNLIGSMLPTVQNHEKMAANDEKSAFQEGTTD
jgi:putative membrane protein